MFTDALVATVTSIAPALVPAGKPNADASAAVAIAPTSANDAPPAPVAKEQVQAAVQQIQKFLAESQRTLDFQIDESSGMPIVTVRDAKGEIIRQIPNAEALHIAQMLKDQGSLRHGLINLFA